MNQFIDLFRQDMNIFYEKTKAFYNGEITKAEYKGISGGFGSYAERDGKANMLRRRLPGGTNFKGHPCFYSSASGRSSA